VVAEDQGDLEGRQALSFLVEPINEDVPFRIEVAVEEVAEQQEVVWLQAVHQPGEPGEVFEVRVARNCDAVAPEVPSFAEVEVGDEEGLV
jgi:hypothetical protein